jgi:hypothetical protein
LALYFSFPSIDQGFHYIALIAIPYGFDIKKPKPEVGAVLEQLRMFPVEASKAQTEAVFAP